jgi:hypothetical protein
MARKQYGLILELTKVEKSFGKKDFNLNDRIAKYLSLKQIKERISWKIYFGMLWNKEGKH